MLLYYVLIRMAATGSRRERGRGAYACVEIANGRGGEYLYQGGEQRGRWPSQGGEQRGRWPSRGGSSVGYNGHRLACSGSIVSVVCQCQWVAGRWVVRLWRRFVEMMMMVLVLLVARGGGGRWVCVSLCVCVC